MNRQRLESSLRHRTARDGLARAVRDAARTIDAQVWLVGGFVRDAALRRPAFDLDLVGGRGTSRLIRELSRVWSARGFRFRKRGVTTYRFVVGGRQVDLVDASRRGLEEDLRRRDFTLNAVAFDLDQGRLHDPLGGLRDLRAGRLRLPRRGVMQDDPLRALRAARFLAQFPDLVLARAAREAAVAVAPRLRRTAVERVRVELEKLLSADAAHRGLEALVDLRLLAPLLPEMLPTRHCQAGQERPDVWTHTVDALRVSCTRRRLPGAAALRTDEARRIVRWALLLHDICKPDTFAVREDGRPTFHGHEVLGARKVEDVLRRLRLPRRQRRRIARLVLLHLRPGHLADAGPTSRGLNRLAREAGEDLPLLLHHAACDALASGSPDEAARWRRLTRVLGLLARAGERLRCRPTPRLVDGRALIRSLGIEPGPQVGRILERIRELQEEGAIRTRTEALDRARRMVREDDSGVD